MATIKALAKFKGRADVQPFEYQPRDLHSHDVELAITHCGVCASDVHQVDNDWKIPQRLPLVPGHEIVGVVTKAGPTAKVRVGERVGVGPQVGACLRETCGACGKGHTQYCKHTVDVYQGVHQPSKTRSHGGFADRIVVDSRWVYRIPENLPSEQAAPLMCAGITVFSPLSRYAGGKQKARVGVVGIGGLGHMALQFANALGCEVTAVSHSPAKEQLARDLGAHHFLSTADKGAMKARRGTLDLMIITISAKFSWAAFISLMDIDSTICVVSVPEEPLSLNPMQLLLKRVHLCGSLLASPAEVHAMLALAAARDIKAMVHTLPMSQANAALDRVRQGKPRFRDVLVQDLSPADARAKL